MSNSNSPSIGFEKKPYGMALVAIIDRKIVVNGEELGVTKSLYNELLDAYEEYHDILVEHGLIEVELSAEDKLDKVLEALQISQQQNALLAQRIELLEKGADHAQQNAVPHATKNEESNAAQTTGQSHDDKGHGANSSGMGNDTGKRTTGKSRGSQNVA